MIPSSIRPQRGPFKPAPHAAALLPALARARQRYTHGVNARGSVAYAGSMRTRPQRTRYRYARRKYTRRQRTHGSSAHTVSTHTAPAYTMPTHLAALRTRHRRMRRQRARHRRAHGVNAHGTGIHDANAQTGLTRTQFSRARTLTHEPCLRTRGLHSPPEVIIQRLENVGYERLEDTNDCFFWTQILLSSPQVNGMTKTEDMNDSFISSASAREIVHNFWPFTTSGRSCPPAVHTLQPFISSQ